MLDSNVSGELTIAASEYVKEGEYWIKKLSGTPGKTTFPYDRFPTQETAEGSLETVKLELPGELHSKLMWIARGYDHTLHMILVTGIVILLHKYTGHRDIIVGAPIYKQDIEGEFVNTVLALRSYVEESMTFKELLLQVRQTILEANENQNYPVETLLYRLNIPFSGGDFPLFDVIVLLEGIHDKKYIEHTLKPNMVFSFRKLEGALEGVVEFNARLYDPPSVKRAAAHFTALLQAVLFSVDVPISGINILSAEEQKQQLFDFNRTRNDYPADKTIHRLIAEQVARTPGDAAVIVSEENGLTLTYSQLEEKASQLANYLNRGRGIKPGELVGILMDSSLELVVAILGILQAGAAYVPMDPVLPEERIKQIIKDADLGLIISLKRQIRLLNRLQWECASFDTFLCMDSRDIHAEEEVEKSELMDEKLWDYVAEIAVDEVTRGGWNSSYTGEPFSEEEMAEYGENILTKLTPLLRKDSRVLEIGCASGISMYRIAPLVGFYHGTDLSAKMIERNKEQVAKEGHTNIVLSQLPAHLIDTVGDKNYDLVILNSVIQSFHGHNYLRKVIRKAIDLLAPQGHLFIGDVMDHDLKRALIRDLVAFRQLNNNKTIQTKTDFSTELFVSRRFFEDLREDIPGISGVAFSSKICTIQNELTRYRYDALITIDKTGKAAGNNGKKRKYQEDARAFEGYGTGQVASGVTSCHPAYVIYTSGTTGTPRGVVITHRSLVNYAAWAVNTYTAGKPVTLPLYSSISFDLTVTSLYLPLLTGGSIAIYSSEKHSFPIERIIKEGRVDIIKATPSHLKLLQNEIVDNNTRLKRFILGGEELERLLAQTIYLGFSRRVEIFNEYGPTEATVGCMIYKFNYEQDRGRSVSIGLPVDNVRIYILDAVLNPVPINGVGEIFIGGDALARGYLNHVDVTVEKFREDETGTTGERRLYRTGDLARRLLDGNIEFLGRADEQVKIRGYRLELQEIENRLRTHSDVREAVVVAVAREVGGGENHIGAEEQDKILCAYIVPDNDREVEVAELIDYLSVHLPDYMIPSYFVPVERIPLTPNGKLDKRALPEPTIASSPDTYAAPENKIQLKLVEIWSNVLGIEKSTISIDANFFELGGHSLRATIVIAQIHKILNVKVPLSVIFTTPTIRGLSEYIRKEKESIYTSIQPIEEKEYYPVSSAQKRMFVLNRLKGSDVSDNTPSAMFVDGNLDIQRFGDVIKRLINRHESLRTSFEIIGEEPAQRIHKEVDFKVDYMEMEAGAAELPDGEVLPLIESDINRIVDRFIRPFDLSKAPLLRVKLVKLREERHLLLYDLHHIIRDGTSSIIFSREFICLYYGMELPVLRVQYKDFSAWQNNLLKSEALKRQEEYWLKRFLREIPVLDMPTDYPRPEAQSFEGDSIDFSFGHDLSSKVKQVVLETGATLYMVLLAVYTILLSRYTGQEDIVVGTPIAGRPHPDLANIIGMFVNTLAMRNFPDVKKSFREFLDEVKLNCLDAYDNQDYQYEQLVDRIGISQRQNWNSFFGTMFAVQNAQANIQPIRQDVNYSVERLVFRPVTFEEKVTQFDIIIHAFEIDEDIHFKLRYCTGLFKRESIEMFIDNFKEIATTVVDSMDIKLKDVRVSHYLKTADPNIPHADFTF